MLLLTDMVDIVSTDTSQSTSQKKTKIRKTNVFESSGLFLPIIVVIYLSL